MEDFMTIEDVSKKLHCSYEFIRKEIQNGNLIAVKGGRKYLIRPLDVSKYLESKRTNIA